MVTTSSMTGEGSTNYWEDRCALSRIDRYIKAAYLRNVRVFIRQSRLCVHKNYYGRGYLCRVAIKEKQFALLFRERDDSREKVI